jgi:hypothetical protein
MKAVLEKHAKSLTLPDIVVTICRNDKEMILRFSDQGTEMRGFCNLMLVGGGIAPEIEKVLWEYDTGLIALVEVRRVTSCRRCHRACRY